METTPKTTQDAAPNPEDRERAYIRLRRISLGTAVAGLLCLGWGAGERFAGFARTPLDPDFLLGFGLALFVGGLLFRLKRDRPANAP